MTFFLFVVPLDHNRGLTVKIYAQRIKRGSRAPLCQRSASCRNLVVMVFGLDPDHERRLITVRRLRASHLTETIIISNNLL